MPTRKPNLTYSAPVGSVDLDPHGWDIWPCADCLPWHVEFVRDTEGDYIAREWHAVDCPTFRGLVNAAEDQDQ